MSFETWTPPATLATFSDGMELKPVFLSYMADTVDADGNTILGAVSILALLSKTPGFPTGAQIVEQTETNDSGVALSIVYPATETRRYLNIVQIGGNTLGVGYLQEQMYGPNPVNNGGVGNPGAFSCTGAGTPTNPVWVPTPVPAAPPVVTPPLVAPAGYQIVPTMFGNMIEPIATASTTTGAGLTATQAATLAELAQDLPRLEALLTQFGH